MVTHYELTIHKKSDKDKISKELLCLPQGVYP